MRNPSNQAASFPTDAKTDSWRVDPRDVLDDPLLHCLYEAARINGRPTSREALIAGLPIENNRLSPKMFIRAANRAKLVARMSKHVIDRRMAPFCPAVALLTDERAVLITEIDRINSTAKVIYPQSPGEPVEFSLKDLEAQSIGYIISVKPRFEYDERSGETKSESTGHWFWSAVLKPWRTYRDVLVASILVNLFALAVPLFTMNVYDRVIPNNALETLWTFAIGVSLALGFDLIMKVLRAHFIDLAGKRVDHEMSSRVMAKVLNSRLEERPASVGSFAANLRSFESVREFLTSATLGMLVDLPFSIIFLLVMAAMGGWLVVPTLIAFGVVLLLSWTVQKRMKPLTDATQRAGQQRNATLIEALVGLETLKGLNAEGRIQKRWEQSSLHLSHVGAKIKLWSAVAVNGTAFVNQIVTVSTIILGVYLIVNNQLTMGALIACSQLAGRALAPLGQLSTLLIQYDNTRSSYQNVDAIMNKQEERSDESRFVMRSRMQGALQFDQVSFHYPNSSMPALDNVSFSVKAGERVAIIGAVGSGKSTIEKLIMGLYQPTGGTIRFDSVDSKQIDPAEIRSSIGYVPQDLTLFFGTLRENVTIASPMADDSSVLSAVALAGLASFTERHPQGINLAIGERGESLSGGQRQSVAIARAVVTEPAIMLLDEPTSSMDSKTESLVIANLRTFSHNRTLLLVTHRMALLELVDRVIVVDKGKIIEDGPRDPIMQKLKGLPPTATATPVARAMPTGKVAPVPKTSRVVNVNVAKKAVPQATEEVL
jgi:ATP-binding cassette, subfamily C, bacterial LapB